ncbi:ANTH domain-containing protein [Russula dissimulans]|nr:ANTH domain-containing protein [Russula dissimulans]
MSSFEKVVKNACKPKPTPPKPKYIDPIVAATWSEDGAIHDVCKALSPRFREPNSIVVFKALIVLHTMIRNGSTDNVLQYLSSSEVLRLKNVVGGQWEGYNTPTNLQHYALYLDTRIRAYRELKHDAIRVQSETNRDLRLSMSIAQDAQRRRPSEDDPGNFQTFGGSARKKTVMGHKLRVLTVEKGLLRETKTVQKMLDALVECRFYLDDLEDQLTITALRMLVKDLLILFQAVNEGVINVLEHYFEMSHVDAEQALAIYRHFCKQAEFAVEFLGVAKKLQNILNVPIPSLKHVLSLKSRTRTLTHSFFTQAPVSLAGALEEYLNDSNFEQNRIEYKANKDAADKNMKNGRTAPKKGEQPSSTPAATNPEASSSKETPKAETAKALTDFFSAIDNESTTIFNPQPASLSSGQFQHVTYNPFSGTSGLSTNPFPQIQAPPQSTGFLQPQFTAAPGVVQPSTNPFPTVQAIPPNFLQSPVTGPNPFRASTLPMQATGLSPFGQTNPLLSAPTGHNPFVSQNGFPGTNPFPITNSSTNPFPAAGQTMNPFPTVGNINPFTALTNNSVPSAAGPNQLSPFTNLNPFPTPSQTVPQPFSSASPGQPASANLFNATMPVLPSTFPAPAPASVPARPASTPLAPVKPAFPPPQPLKPHQTGSRNPFGAPKAPSPPPLPRAPTLFELANGVAQPQQQSDSGVLVKPQPTGFPTTTFSSVASSFITGGAQAPQSTTSPFTSLGSSSTTTALSPSLTETATTGSTFSTSLFSSPGGQSTGSTVLSSQPTGAPFRSQTTGFGGGVKAFKPTSSFGASLLEALPPIPQSAPTTPETGAASAAASPPSGTSGTNGIGLPAGMGLGASFSGVSSPAIGGGPLTNGGTGFGSSVGFATQPTGLSAVKGVNGTGSGGLTALGAGSYLGVGLRPQATGVGLGAANPFRASMMTPNAGSSAGAFPAFANGNSPFLSPTGAPSFGQSLFLGAQTDASKQFNSAAPLI